MLFVALIGCSGPATEPATPVPTPPTSTGDTGGPTMATADTGSETLVVDCANLPTSGFFSEDVPSARSYHGLAFDSQGALIGSNGTSLIKAFAYDDASLYVPNVGSGEQMDLLPNGDLAWSQDPEIVRITPDGNRMVLVDNVNAYGLIVGPDGFIYTANQSEVERIDPVSGQRTPYTTGVGSPKVINWSPDYTKFYVGTNFDGGNIYVYDIDPTTFEPLGGPTLFASTPNTWHDTLGVDICGNLYVAEFWERSLWRFTPEGDRTLLVNFNATGQSNRYVHALEWGSGVGVWDALSIYVGQPYDGNTVRRVQIGVPSRRYQGPVEVIR